MRFLLITILVATLTGCTYSMWSDHDYVEEEIVGFYVNPERSELLVFGQSRGYVFPIDDEFEEILILSRTISLTPYFFAFAIDRRGLIEGTAEFLVSTSDLSDEQIARLEASAFQEGMVSGVLSFKSRMKGRVYDLAGDLPLRTLEEHHRVRIAIPDGPIHIARKIVATPATIVYDTVVIPPGVLLLVLVMSTDSL